MSLIYQNRKSSICIRRVLCTKFLLNFFFWNSFRNVLLFGKYSAS